MLASAVYAAGPWTSRSRHLSSPYSRYAGVHWQRAARTKTRARSAETSVSRRSTLSSEGGMTQGTGKHGQKETQTKSKKKMRPQKKKVPVSLLSVLSELPRQGSASLKSRCPCGSNLEVCFERPDECARIEKSGCPSPKRDSHVGVFKKRRKKISPSASNGKYRLEHWYRTFGGELLGGSRAGTGGSHKHRAVWGRQGRFRMGPCF